MRNGREQKFQGILVLLRGVRYVWLYFGWPELRSSARWANRLLWQWKIIVPIFIIAIGWGHFAFKRSPDVNKFIAESEVVGFTTRNNIQIPFTENACYEGYPYVCQSCVPIPSSGHCKDVVVKMEELKKLWQPSPNPGEIKIYPYEERGLQRINRYSGQGTYAWDFVPTLCCARVLRVQPQSWWVLPASRFYKLFRKSDLIAISFLAVIIIPAITIPLFFFLLIPRFILSIVQIIDIVRHSLLSSTITSLPPDEPEESVDLVACQLSDLHICNSDSPPYEIQEDPKSLSLPTLRALTGEVLINRSKYLLYKLQIQQPPLLLITGDLTDQGDATQWSSLDNIFQGITIDRVALIPGNHDISLNIGTQPDLSGVHRQERIKRFNAALFNLEKGNWHQCSPKRLFPRCLTIAQTRVFSLDSNCYRSGFVLSNAVGLYSSEQLSLLRNELNSGVGPVMVLSHHHVGRSSHGNWDPKDIMMIVLDGKELLEILASYSLQNSSNAVLIVHGHRHIEQFGAYSSRSGGKVYVYGHPSSCLGDSSDGLLDGQIRYTNIYLSKSNKWYIKTFSV